ncbi:hypothetical protein EVA_11782, partial [gut metagenome]
MRGKSYGYGRGRLRIGNPMDLDSVEAIHAESI